MDELELIRRVTAELPTTENVVVGAGDDCAALKGGREGSLLLFKTDAVVEGVHFTSETPPEKIGRKALARCLSDIAAMAGTPTAALVTAGLPEGFDPERALAVSRGVNDLARRHNVAIVGGETTTNPERMLISISLLGEALEDKIVLRSGAKAGDAVFVSGELGGSLEGKHLDFEPRLEQARWLADHFKPNAMIDLSDGLASDLRHILEASGVGAELRSASVPISRAARQAAANSGNGRTPLNRALSDGEDFELLFTLPSRDAVPVLDGWKAAFPDLRLTCVGRILAEPGLRIRDDKQIRPIDLDGYVHFKQPE